MLASFITYAEGGVRRIGSGQYHDTWKLYDELLRPMNGYMFRDNPTNGIVEVTRTIVGPPAIVVVNRLCRGFSLLL